LWPCSSRWLAIEVRPIGYISKAGDEKITSLIGPYSDRVSRKS
jgi:hypothetical protein